MEREREGEAGSWILSVKRKKKAVMNLMVVGLRTVLGIANQRFKALPFFSFFMLPNYY